MPNWSDVLKEIQIRRQADGTHALDNVRRGYLLKLHEKTGRNLIAYYSGFLSKPGIAQLEINDEDKNGFMMAVYGLDKTKGLDLILHTPGGSVASTQSIVHYLQKIFKSDIRAIIPQIAMSAGTMIACSCREIWMGKHSNLGPIDPHLHGIPAHGVLMEFQRACEEIKKDPSKIPIWQQIIGQYRPTFLSRCENAIKWSDEFVRDQLKSVMFSKEVDAEKKAQDVVEKLTDYSGNKSHERHIHYEECKSIGLNIQAIEEDPEFQDLVLTVHHCYMHIFMNTSVFKVIENHNGAAIVKTHSISPPRQQ